MRARTAFATVALVLAAGAGLYAATVDIVRDKWGVPHIPDPPRLLRQRAHVDQPGRDATLVESLRTALTSLTTQFGTTDPMQWLTPKITVEFDEISASSFLYGDTVIEREDRGTMNQLIELLPTVASQIIVPPGNSGHIPPALFPEPPHLRDQVAPYEAFQYHTLPFSPAELEGPTTTQTITVP
jgi:acyl-homoserine lactone acylase PvdQ